MAILTNTILLSALLGHLSVDILNGQRPVLFTFLSVPLGLSISQLGIFSTAYTVAAALIQPVFGYVADRVGSRVGAVHPGRNRFVCALLSQRQCR